MSDKPECEIVAIKIFYFFLSDFAVVARYMMQRFAFSFNQNLIILKRYGSYHSRL